MGEKTSISPFIRAISSLSLYIPETHSIQVLATVLENKETQPFQSSICQNEAIQYSFDHDDLKTTINKITEFISTSQNINSGVETCINLLISFLIQRPNKRQLFLDLFSLLIIKYSQQTSDIIKIVNNNYFFTHHSFIQEILEFQGSLPIKLNSKITSNSFGNTRVRINKQELLYIYKEEKIEYIVLNNDLPKLRDTFNNDPSFNISMQFEVNKSSPLSVLFPYKQVTLVDFSAFYEYINTEYNVYSDFYILCSFF